MRTPSILGNRTIKITHIITGLGTGGAEMMLYKLLSGMDKAHFEQKVISLTTGGAIGDKISALGIPVWTLGMRPGFPNPMAVLHLAKKLRQERPDITQTWMYHADLLGGIAARLAGCPSIVWGMRNTDLNPSRVKASTIWTARVCALFSSWLPEKIFINSLVSRDVHVKLGYKAEKMIVIPNGFDLQNFQPDTEARSSVRNELSISPETPLIGMVARFDSQKDHHNFIQAAGQLVQSMPQTHFMLCGEGITWQNRVLADWIITNGLQDSFHLLGERDDISRLTASFDIASLSSVGEAFPNVVGEAMACGIPCVVTDAGDSTYIVGDTGKVVAIKDPQAMAEAWREMLSMPPLERVSLGLAARARVENLFSLVSVCKQYEGVYQNIFDHQ